MGTKVEQELVEHQTNFEALCSSTKQKVSELEKMKREMKKAEEESLNLDRELAEQEAAIQQLRESQQRQTNQLLQPRRTPKTSPALVPPTPCRSSLKPPPFSLSRPPRPKTKVTADQPAASTTPSAFDDIMSVSDDLDSTME